MKTEDLIRAMAADAILPPAALDRVLWLPLALGLSFLGLWATLGLRDGLGTALQDPLSLMRIVLSASLGGMALAAVLRLARPGAVVWLWPLAGVALVAAGLWIWSYGQVPEGGQRMAIVGKTMVGCLTAIPLLSILPVAAVLSVLQRGAPTRPMVAGAVAGLAGGGFAAAIYALHCTEDSPLFYVTWYGTAILAVSAVSALIAARLLRW
ncbi:MAG: NrsF family protein [Paracoccaceae bacterium]